MFECAEEDWQKALNSGSVEKCQQFLAGTGLPLEATALEHGFVPESIGITAVQMERGVRGFASGRRPQLRWQV